ncbi:type II toxin-antitoxin system RelE/ParE family toxin [Carboxydichorda subterranea]|uniref:type II toxin-antitoxin system RelE/ParE family toxin n=1 Tax=Carboxydichorda subterranea TaxID=3109565 RepID=UPI0038571F95
MDDLEAIVDYIARDSPDYARRLASRIVTLAEEIASYPGLGRMVPEFGVPSLRERICQGYRVVYRVRDNGSVVEIVRVQHGARLLTDL